jgi:hypothetical protein
MTVYASRETCWLSTRVEWSSRMATANCLQAFSDQTFLPPGGSPLSRRGWVFQERMLAARAVHFTKNQVFCECSSLQASEILPKGLPRGWSARRPRQLARDFAGVLTRKLARASTGGLAKALSRVLATETQNPQKYLLRSGSSASRQEDEWWNMVTQYSRTSLTFANDRLLAFSALAKRYCLIKELEQSNYVAGMWRHQLPLSLLWYYEFDTSSDAKAEMPPAVTGIAPSWSWASVLARIDTVEPTDLVATCSVRDIRITRRSLNFFDGANSCHLRLCSSVCRFRRTRKDAETWLHFDHRGKGTAVQESRSQVVLTKERSTW